MKKNSPTRSLKLLPNVCEKQKEISDFGKEIHRLALGLRNLLKIYGLAYNSIRFDSINSWEGGKFLIRDTISIYKNSMHYIACICRRNTGFFPIFDLILDIMLLSRSGGPEGCASTTAWRLHKGPTQIPQRTTTHSPREKLVWRVGGNVNT